MIRSAHQRLVRFGFRLLYNECAFAYDAVSWLVSLGRWRRWGRITLRDLDAAEPGIVLELAHGSGGLQLDLRQARHVAVGIDLSARMGRIAKSKLEASGAHANLARADALNLPFRSGVIAALVCAFPTRFILQDRALRELHRVLRPGGKASIVLSAWLTGGGIRRGLIRFACRLTGQGRRPATDFSPVDAFAKYGFLVAHEHVDCGDSVVHLVTLMKPGSPPQAE